MFSSDGRGSRTLQELQDTAEHLFLLECHVSKIHIPTPNLLNNLDKSVCQQTRITVSFLNFSELELCDEQNEEYKKCCYSRKNPYYICGKSFLFALPRQCLLHFATYPVDPHSFTLTIKVYEVNVNNTEIVHSLLGFCKIPLGDRFAEILRIPSCEVMNRPTSCSLKEEFQFLNPDGCMVGLISAFVRVSCFGKMIVTQLHMSPDSIRKELPTDLNRKIIEPCDIHGASLPPFKAQQADHIQDDMLAPGRESSFKPPETSKFVDACTSPIRSLEFLDEEFRTQNKRDSMSIDSKIKGNLIEDIRKKEWEEVFGYPHTEATSEFQEYCEERFPTIRRPSIEELAEPEFAYEEIHAKVNGHTLFFKVLKSSKKSKKQKQEDTLLNEMIPEKHALEPNFDQLSNHEYARSATTAKHGRSETAQSSLLNQHAWDDHDKSLLMARKGKRPHKISRSDEEYQGDERPCYPPPPSKVGDHQGEAIGREKFMNIAPKPARVNRKKKFGNPQRLGSGDLELEFEDGLRTPPTQCLLERNKDAEPQEIAENDLKEKSEPNSKSKEVFSLNVGKKIGTDGKVRPKIILKIRAPKTKEELKEEEETAKQEEEKLQKLEEKKRGKEFVARETQYASVDFGPPDLSFQPNQNLQRSPKPSISKGGNKVKKEKKR